MRNRAICKENDCGKRARFKSRGARQADLCGRHNKAAATLAQKRGHDQIG